MKQQYPLHTFVNRILLRRLALVTLVVTLVVGGTAWVQTRNLATERVVEVALDRLAVIRAQYLAHLEAGLAPSAAVDAALEDSGNIEYINSRGKFIFGVFHDAVGDFATYRDTGFPQHAPAERLVGPDRSRRPAKGDDYRALVQVGGRAAVKVVVPIAGRDEPADAWFTGIYLLSPAAAAELVREPWTAVGWVILIVLAVSALFYPVVLRLAKRLAGYSADLLEANLEMIEALGCAISKRDGDTDAHNYRVTIYSVKLAEKEGLSLAEIQGLIKGAFLHDIGKIGIRDDVLLKPGKLTEEEYAVMQTHVVHGLDIVKRARWLNDALDIVGSHHEKFAGDGYPAAISGDLIPTAARIFAIADVFDALSSPRPYKEALPVAKVMAILEEGRGTHFDPHLLSGFLTMAPDLHAELAHLDIEELRSRMHDINRRYFASGLEVILA